jgi:Tol biopolymer transport system component/predicted Ser/Thr protein kinase
MAILPGKRLGPYEILSSIGAGGMGEVYRARDTRLDRIVAIKVLPTHLADRSELRERFDREAKTVASLNHPHICTLYDVGHQDGIDYLVMEYLEGETLAQRLQKGALPLEQALQYAIEISDALDKAHRKGVTHRDLKPGNIMLTKTGTKLLDFGLAKLKQEAAPANVSLSDLPTAKDPLTAEGAIVGTLQYMAPEQVEGKTDQIDARTDIFTFGAVVYEMGTGKKAFEGKTQASLIAAILERDPPAMSSLQPMAPPALDRVVKKCLAKEPEKRWQAASDVCDELKWIAEGGSQIGLAPAATIKGIRALGRREVIIGSGVSLLSAVVSGIAVWKWKPPAPQPVTSTVINLPPGQQFAGLDVGPALALSPDGTVLAYIARQSGTQQLYLRAMDRLEAKPIPGTDGAFNPFFSPDSQWLGFFVGQKVKKISVNGGAALTLGDASFPHGASWSSLGVIAFSPSIGSSLKQVPDGGGTPQLLTRLQKGEVNQRWPEFLPGAKAVLFTGAPTNASWNNAEVAAQSVETGERRNLIQGGTHPRYAASGHLVYAQGGSLMAVPFDPGRLAITGAAVPIVEGVLQSPSSGAAQYSLSATGSLVYISGGVQADQRRLVWVTRNGAEQPVAAPARSYVYPRISPDGQLISVGITEEDTQIWLYDLSREKLTRITFGGSVNQDSTWTPDGKRIAVQSNREGPLNMFWQLADGSGGVEHLVSSEYDNFPISWSPDGQLLAFAEVNPTTGYDIWVLRLSDRKAQPFLRTTFNESAAHFSPDGRWLAYISDESGRFEIYVQPYPGPGGKWQISTEGGTEPVWNRNGRELFYRSGGKMMAVDITTQPTFASGKPRMLFEGQYSPAPGTANNFDVSSDGQRFLMIKPNEAGEAAPTQINVVLNWFEELKQKVPTGKK